MTTTPQPAGQPGDDARLLKAYTAATGRRVEDYKREGTLRLLRIGADAARCALEASRAPAVRPEPAALPGWRFEVVSDGDVRAYGPHNATWLVLKDHGDEFVRFVHTLMTALATPPQSAPTYHLSPGERRALRKALMRSVTIIDGQSAPTDDVAQLRAELERERMRLAACGVVALADTPASAAQARDMHPDYRSASCDDVARRVDECIQLRAALAERAFLQPQDLADLTRLDDLFSDGEGWDLPKHRMQRLAELGVIRHTSAGRYAITAFGLACLRVDGFPLRTVAEHIEASRLAMEARNEALAQQHKESSNG
jgi:hypothetical protein